MIRTTMIRTTIRMITNDTDLASLLCGAARIPCLGAFVTRDRLTFGVVDPFTHFQPLFQHPKEVAEILRAAESINERADCCVMGGKDGIHSTHCVHFRT